MDISVSEKRTSTADESRFEYEIKLTLGPKNGLGEFKGVIQFRTDDPDNPETTLPVTGEIILNPAGAGNEAAKDFAIGESDERSGHPGSALYYFELVQRHYPGSEHAKLAAKRIAALRVQAQKAAMEADSKPAKKAAPRKLFLPLRAVDFGTVTRGQTPTKYVFAESTNVRILNVVKQASAPFALYIDETQHPAPPNDPSDSCLLYKIKLFVKEDAAPGPFKETVLLKTDDPAEPTVQVIVTGRIQVLYIREKDILMLSSTGTSPEAKRMVEGERRVRLDGTVSLGTFGGVHVANQSLDEAKAAIESHLADRLPKVKIKLRLVRDGSPLPRLPDIDKKDDNRTPLLPPVGEGQPGECFSPPSREQVLAALPKPEPGTRRTNIRISYERLVDRIDPPRFFPLVGPARLHHVHWKCNVHCDEIKEASPPAERPTTKAVTHVVYIDKDHLHLERRQR